MGESGKDDTDPKELINYKDVPSDIKAQMEEAAGYEPSRIHGDELETEDMERGARQATALGTVNPDESLGTLGLSPQVAPQQGRNG